MRKYQLCTDNALAVIINKRRLLNNSSINQYYKSRSQMLRTAFIVNKSSIYGIFSQDNNQYLTKKETKPLKSFNFM
jgi:hypothetical protein